ncbi:MAG: hypothetical protein ABSB35_12085 [Bryobacteraceae bacterium]|jgi:hypothetical protein
MRIVALLALFAFSAVSRAQIACRCDPKIPETMKERQCGLCEIAEQQPLGILFFTIRDNSLRKPDRMLALPRQHSPGMHQISALPAEVRAALWGAAIAKSKELWGDRWGVAYNAEKLHSQCHVHIHIGRLIDGVEAGDLIVVNSPEEIPLPGDDGLWIHGVNGKFHVHIHEQVTETVLWQ